MAHMLHHVAWRTDAGHLACIAALVLMSGAPTHGQTIAPEFAADYSYIDLGQPAGVTGNLGGLTLLASDPNSLLIGGNANGPSGSIFRIGITRDAGNHITGFTGVASLFASAPEIDGGLAYGPGGVLFYTGYNENLLGQIRPGSVAPDKVIELGPLGIARSVGTLNFIPAGFPLAGKLLIATFNSGQFYTADLTPDGSGTYDLADITNVTSIPRGPEGFIYVPPVARLHRAVHAGFGVRRHGGLGLRPGRHRDPDF